MYESEIRRWINIRVPNDFGGEEWESRWEDYVACGAAVPEAESRDAWMYYVKELHTRFEGYECCIDASVARTAAHEDLKVLFAALGSSVSAYVFSDPLRTVQGRRARHPAPQSDG